MAQPTPYVRQYNFTQFSIQHPSDQQPGVQLDLELNTVKASLNAAIANLGLIQRDDGALANNSVGLNQLSPDVLLGTLNPPTDWVTATAYERFDIVWYSNALYLCNTDHTSGVFATDLGADKWTAFLDYSSPLSAAEAAATAAAASEAAASGYADDAQGSADDAADSATAAAASAAAAAAFYGTISFPIAVALGGTGANSSAGAAASLGVLPLSGGTMTGALTLYADPANALHAATKQYVDNLVNGLKPKGSVQLATTANIALAGEQSIDGTITAASRVLVKNQTTASQNGIYISSAGAWSRDPTMDSWTEVPGATVVVESGSTNADKGFVCTADQGGTLGTTAITWTQFLGTGAYQAASANLTTYDGTPLTSAELTQLQNIGVNTISAAQWGYLASVTAAGAALWDDASASAQRTTLGLGTSAIIDTGTSGTKVALTDGANTWSGATTWSSTMLQSAAAPNERKYESDAGSNAKYWDDTIDAGVRTWSLYNDALNASNALVTITRTAHTAATWNFGSIVTLQLNGSQILSLANIGTLASNPTFIHTGSDTIVGSQGGSGYGAFNAVGSGTNSAYMFFQNVTNAERARMWADNSRNMGFSTDGGTTTHLNIDSNGDVVRKTDRTTNQAGSVGYMGSPVSTMSGNRTIAFVDNGQTLYHTSATPHTLTIDSNANLALPVGFMFSLEVENGSGAITVNITTDTLRWGSSTGSRTVSANGSALFKKVASTTWRVTGINVT